MQNSDYDERITWFPRQIHTLLLLGHPFPIGAMAAAEAAAKEKIVKLAEETFCGPGDIEAQDAKSLHQYFKQTYPPGSAERSMLLSDLHGLDNRLKALTGWVPPAAVDALLPFNAGQIQSFVVAPWQLGLAAEDTVSHFLVSPYRSEREPWLAVFSRSPPW